MKYPTKPLTNSFFPRLGSHRFTLVMEFFHAAQNLQSVYTKRFYGVISFWTQWGGGRDIIAVIINILNKKNDDASRIAHWSVYLGTSIHCLLRLLLLVLLFCHPFCLKLFILFLNLIYLEGRISKRQNRAVFHLLVHSTVISVARNMPGWS